MFTRAGTVWSPQGVKLTGAGETGEGEFGTSVALALEGTTTTALMGGPRDNANIGAVWVFTRPTTGGAWSPQGAKLTGSGEAGEGEVGRSVALSLESSTMTALTGGPHDNLGVGAAWAYTRAGTTWSAQGGKLTGKEEVGAGESIGGKGQVGYSAALSSDGNTALIGGPTDVSAGLLSAGAAWVFTRSGGVWTQQGARLTAGGEIGGGEFGASVALSSDGNTALIGGPNDNNGLGAAWVFTRSGGVWTQQGTKLTGSGESALAKFGASVALSSDGNTALIGGPADNNVGAAWAFTRSGSIWTQQGEKLIDPAEPGGGEFGGSVALSVDGNTALLGAAGVNASAGAAWVFTRSGSTWTQQSGELKGGAEVGAGEFGKGVALSADGNTALMGGPGDNTNLGAAWVFTRSGGEWTQQGAKLTGSGETGEGEFGTSVALSAEATTALIGGAADNTKVGAAWVFTRSERSESSWSQGPKLTAKSGEEIGEGLFGASVALSSEGNTALIGGPGDNINVGAAWVFVNTAPTVVTKRRRRSRRPPRR